MGRRPLGFVSYLEFFFVLVRVISWIVVAALHKTATIH